MANLIYNKFLEQLAKGNIDLESVVLRWMLERSTSTYAPNKDHDFVDDLTDFVEVSVASYARLNSSMQAVTEDDANDRADFDLEDLDFGALEAGQTVKGLLAYIQVGGDDTTPEDDILVCYIDTTTGLPAILTGSPFTATIDAEGLIRFYQP